MSACSTCSASNTFPKLELSDALVAVMGPLNKLIAEVLM